MNILSFDVEEWFHINNSDWISRDEWPHLERRVEGNTGYILNILKKYNVKATFFVLGWIAEYYPELIKRIYSQGHDVGYHSYFHTIPRNQAKKEFEHDLLSGLEKIESIIGDKVSFYRAPNFSLKNKWMLDCLIDHGIEVSSSIKNPMIHDKKSLPNQPFILQRDNRKIIEFPLNTMNMVFVKYAYSGSGYFRITLYPIVKRLFNLKTYNMVYFHPNDFDNYIPTPLVLGFKRNFLNTIGTKNARNKFEKLLTDFNFQSISKAINNFKTDDLDIVKY